MTPMDKMLASVEWVNAGNTEDVAMADDSMPWVTHSGVLDIAGHKLRCYRLNNGQAIFDADDVHAFFGFSDDKDQQ